MALRTLRCRQPELARLQSGVLAADARPRLVVVEGPRRVGKSFLLHHLLASLPSEVTPVYFEATQGGERDQLRRFAEAVATALGQQAPPMGGLSSWDDALASIAYVARQRRLVVVIDEATYLTATTTGFMSTVKSLFDQLTLEADAPALTLILTGSAVGLMTDALDHRGPLYGRTSDILRLRPFTAAQASEFCGHPDPVALLEAYAACGGYPLHLDAWDFAADTQVNLQRLATSPGGLLLEDAGLLLATLPDASRRTLIAVGQGRAKRGEIQNEVGARVDRPLESLLRARYVQAVTPLGAPLRARPEFRVDDAYLRFWFRVISGGVQRIEAGQGATVLAGTAEQWQGQLGWCFEQAARDHALRLTAAGELPTAQVGEWWTVSGQQCQLDVLGLDQHRTVFVGEAKWSRRPLGSAEVDELARRGRLAPRPVAQPTLVLWGRGGVRPEVQVGAVRGYGPEQMLRG